jgi:hypothetical protein
LICPEKYPNWPEQLPRTYTNLVVRWPSSKGKGWLKPVMLKAKSFALINSANLV